MITKSAFALVAAIAAAGIASPAFAQAFGPKVGSGNIVGVYIGPAAPQQQSGLQAHAMVPDPRAANANGVHIGEGSTEFTQRHW
jgi:hypothetical protein